jgi:hypothetical protein
MRLIKVIVVQSIYFKNIFNISLKKICTRTYIIQIIFTTVLVPNFDLGHGSGGNTSMTKGDSTRRVGERIHKPELGVFQT